MPFSKSAFSGFPFERETTDRDAHFRSQLDDIAKRHPEFAEHLGNLRTGTGVRRQSSLGGADEPDFSNSRRFQRPFGSRFERFGFPFDGDDFDPEKYAQQFYKPYEEEFNQQQPSGHGQQQQPSGYSQQQPSGYSQPQPSGYSQQQPSGYSQQQPSGYSQQQPSGYSQQPSGYGQQRPAAYSPQQQQPQPEYPQPEPQPQNTDNAPPDPERGRNNIQQSNTVDLGQKQEPVNDRSQRSMSAPPPEKGQRFTSSINIPVNQPDQGEDNMAQTQQQQANAKTTERIIPIHVEDRDEPVLPKKGAPTYSQQHSLPTFGGSPQPETIFGRRPEDFTHFVNREPRQYEKWHSGFNHPDEFMRQQRFPQQQNVPPQQHHQQPAPKPQPQPKGDIPIPVQVEVPHTKQKANQRAASPQPPQQQQAPPEQPQPPKAAPQQQKKPLTPLEQIEAILAGVAPLAAEVEKFEGKPKDKQYLYLDEMLTRHLLKLDNVDTQGQDDIRTARKEAIKSIEKTIGVLESRAAGNVQQLKEEKMEVEGKTEETQVMEVAAEGCNKSDSQQPMEVVAENTVNPEGGVQVTQENKSGSEGPKVEGVAQVPVENRAVLVENKPEVVENRAVLVENPNKQENPAEEAKMETCEGQESNLAVADAVKKFEGAGENKDITEGTDGVRVEGDKGSSQEGEAKAEDKKGKKKGKKKVEKKDK